jgi:hypothetical protein
MMTDESVAAYLETVRGRLTTNGFALSDHIDDIGAARRQPYNRLQSAYYFIGKRQRYYLLSLFGFVEDHVMVGAEPFMNVEIMELCISRARSDALKRRSHLKFICPVVYVYVFAVIVADKVDPELTDHFAANVPPQDSTAVVLPVVLDRRTSMIDYHRKVPWIGSAHVKTCHPMAEQFFAPT